MREKGTFGEVEVAWATSGTGAEDVSPQMGTVSTVDYVYIAVNTENSNHATTSSSQHGHAGMLHAYVAQHTPWVFLESNLFIYYHSGKYVRMDGQTDGFLF